MQQHDTVTWYGYELGRRLISCRNLASFGILNFLQGCYPKTEGCSATTSYPYGSGGYGGYSTTQYYGYGTTSDYGYGASSFGGSFGSELG